MLSALNKVYTGKNYFVFLFLLPLLIYFTFLISVKLNFHDDPDFHFRINNFVIPNLTQGNLECGRTLKKMAEQLLKKHGNNSIPFLYETYYHLARQNMKKNSLDILHFTYSNILNSLKNKNSCIDFPKSYYDDVVSQIKGLRVTKPSIFPSSQVEVFYFEHGLRFADKRILDYISKRDILDIGACEGDSAYIFMNRTEKRIFSYEPSRNNVKVIQNIAKHLHFDPQKFILVPKGISNKNEKRRLTDCTGGGCSSTERQDGFEVDFVTIDSEVERNHMTLGLIKADTEGFGFPVFLGGIKSFQRDRPVFTLSIYHNFEELYEIPKHILELGGYEIEFQIQREFFSGEREVWEMVAFAYPKEIFE